MAKQTAWEKVNSLVECAAAAPGGAVAGAITAFPGASLIVAKGGTVQHQLVAGCRSIVPERTPVTSNTVYDIASLTKVMVTTTLAMKLVEQGMLDLDWKVSRVFQTFGVHGKEQMKMRHLLAHCSGYPATSPYYKQLVTLNKGERSGLLQTRAATEYVYAQIMREKLRNLPGRVAEYSDLGFILLGHVVETLSGGTTLGVLAHKRVFQPLGLRETGYIDLKALRLQGLEPVNDMIAPTLECPWRGHVLCGEVHDDNAWAMGGVAAHAGVFSTANDVLKFSQVLLDCYHGRNDFISPDVVRAFWRREGTVADSSWAYGWDTPSESGSSAGRYFSPNSVGHLGYTGCSLWIDPEREVIVVFLTNRIHPSDENKAIRTFRPELHDAVMEALGYGEHSN